MRMPAFLMTLPILAISAFIVADSPSGELPTTSVPELKNFSYTSGVCRTCIVSLLKRLTIAGGAPAGANIAIIPTDS